MRFWQLYPKFARSYWGTHRTLAAARTAMPTCSCAGPGDDMDRTPHQGQVLRTSKAAVLRFRFRHGVTEFSQVAAQLIPNTTEYS
jgi:hypothetical protein